MTYNWSDTKSIGSYGYKCGHCDNNISSNSGYFTSNNIKTNDIIHQAGKIYICHACNKPTFIDFVDDIKQYPGASFGSSVRYVTETGVDGIYQEARRCMSANAPTASVLCCRKLLMHIAVAKKAPKGQTFVEYVQYLSDNGFVPPDAKGWVDHIRTKGNEANHEITMMERKEAERLIQFCEILLKIIYEFPASVPKPKS